MYKRGPSLERIPTSETAARQLENGHSELRQSLKESMQNIGILAAFLAGLAAVAYSTPPPKGLCWGQPALDFIVIMEWFGMGCFFLSIIFSVTLISDLDGVPEVFLISHLKDSAFAHSLPLALTFLGAVLIAVGYGFDLNERIGCPIFPFGVIIAPMFPSIVIGLHQFLRRKRRRLFAKFGGPKDAKWKVGLGSSIFLPWSDLVKTDLVKNVEKEWGAQRVHVAGFGGSEGRANGYEA